MNEPTASRLLPTAPPVEGAARGVRVDVSAQSHVGLVRETNEDSVLVFRIGRYFERVSTNLPADALPERFGETGIGMIVADGVGGHEAGEVASRLAITTTVQFIASDAQWILALEQGSAREARIEQLQAKARACLADIHQAIRNRAQSDATLAGMGTTFTCAYSVGLDLFVLHVGDSKAFLLRGGTLERITVDHTVAQQYADLGLIHQEDVRTHRMQHVLTRAAGGPEEALEGDMHLLRLRIGDRLLLCSDGLVDQADEATLAQLLAANPLSQDACRALVEHALGKGGRDNITAVVASYQAE